jgi:glycosyltransferase involved in cell wall biosynthesis
MNILVVHNSLMDSKSVSGVLKHYAFMASEWIAAGHPTDFLVARAGFPQFQSLTPQAGLVSSDNLFDATRYLAQTSRYFPAYAWRCATAHFVRLPRRYDVVYASGQFIVDIYCARVIARRLGVPWVAKIQHVLHSQPKRQGLINRLFLDTEKLAAKWMNRHAARVMCLSGVVARDYRALEESLGLTPANTDVIGCGIDVEAIRSVPAAEPEYDVVFLGRMHEQKGVFELPKVWQQVLAKRPQAKLLVIGEGPHRRQTEAMFAELGMDSGVTFTGGIEERHKNELLARCRVGLSLSYEEGWGLSVTEFLASGLPVVAYDLPVFADVFPDRLETVKPGDTTMAAQAILALLDDEERRQARGAAGKEFVRKYDYRHVAPDELRVLEAAVGRPAKSR